MPTSSKEICLFKTYIETTDSFNTEQDSFRNIKQAILQCNVSKRPKFYISSALKGDSQDYTSSRVGAWILIAQQTVYQLELHMYFTKNSMSPSTWTIIFKHLASVNSHKCIMQED